MKCIKTSLIAGAAAAMTMTAPAFAADMPMPVYKAPVVLQTGGWYLRGDIGFSNQKVDELTSPVFTPAVTVLKKEVDAAPFGGLGIGYQFNNWFRVDVTGEYRGGATFRGLDTYTVASNDYFGTKSEWLFMGNAYVDLGTWWGFTPFVGAGIGYSRNTISNWRDINNQTGATAYADTHSQWEFAWAVHAGLAYQVTPNFTVEFAYRYLDLGDFATADMIGFNGQNAAYNPIYLNGVTSHDFKLGLRWNLSPVQPVYAPAYAPPLMTKG
ncbi:outer membrane protein [Pseudorhodoplanes sp.]|uniref:outer membrane protein n=1 Tax=Pseudorhodoplanes sp. TaxID=1934341 RepID=UPI00391A148A